MEFEKVKQVVVDTLGCDEAAVELDARFLEDLDADSLDIVQINMEIEKALGVNVPDEEIPFLKTVGDLYKFVSEHA